MNGLLFDKPALLFLPASNPRAIAKARDSAADLVILDLEDAVKPEDKEVARDAAVAALAERWPMPVGIRINVTERSGAIERHPPFEPSAADCAAIGSSNADFVVVPKVEESGIVERVFELTGKPVLAMVETPYAILFLREWVASPALAGLIAGTNDLAAGLRVAGPQPRAAMSAALQMIVCAGRAVGLPTWDGVYNRLDDPEGFSAEAAPGRSFGFDGKSLIHPDQIAPCHSAFAPTDEEIDCAERLVAAASGGAERFEGAMVEEMHVAAARRLLARR